MRSFISFAFAMIVGCSGADFDTAATGEDSSVDSSIIDTGSSGDSSSVDSSTVDSGSIDTGTIEDSAKADTFVGPDAKPDAIVMLDGPDPAPCHSFWCGCGTCTAKDVTCTKDTTLGCPLGCPSSPCPPAEMPGVCSNVGDRCVRNGIDGEIACYHTGDCPPGKCCKGASSPPSHGVCVTAPDSDCVP
jgi:hypothetical protein